MKLWTETYKKFSNLDSDDESEASSTAKPAIIKAGDATTSITTVTPTRFDFGEAGQALTPTTSFDFAGTPAFAVHHARVRALPLNSRQEVWQVACRQLPCWTAAGDGTPAGPAAAHHPVRPWAVLVRGLG